MCVKHEPSLVGYSDSSPFIRLHSDPLLWWPVLLLSVCKWQEDLQMDTSALCARWVYTLQEPVEFKDKWVTLIDTNAAELNVTWENLPGRRGAGDCECCSWAVPDWVWQWGGDCPRERPHRHSHTLPQGEGRCAMNPDLILHSPEDQSGEDL